MSGNRVFGTGNAAASAPRQRFLHLTILTVAGAVAASGAEAATMTYWQDSDPGYYRLMPMAQPRKPKAKPAAKAAKPIKDTNAKPQGPLIISVSIDQQWLRLYDANGLFAESPVSTGMRGHATPMGVFSVIQKNKMHRSNIYSGAPMPFMQRITWSGIALHAGALPGYPASHGCIRMPTAFATKMWNWTRMGARVIITPGTITPASFSHPMLATQKVVPQPLIANDPSNDAPAVKSDKGADAGVARPDLELRSTVGHASQRSRTLTADAGATVPAANNVSDAAPSGPAMTASGETPSDATTGTAIVELPTAAIDKAGPAAVAKRGEEARPSDPKAVEKPADPAGTATDAPAAIVKDAARPPGVEKAAPRRPGQIAVFVSRKDAKLYVRESFKPQFEVPVTIAPGDRPLGTHVFTAEVDKTDTNLLRWSAVSLPVVARQVARTDDDVRRRKPAAPAEAAPNSAAEALDRITVPPEAMTRIAELLSTGGSIIISDLGVSQGGETGEGTDFIVPLR